MIEKFYNVTDIGRVGYIRLDESFLWKTWIIFGDAASDFKNQYRIWNAGKKGKNPSFNGQEIQINGQKFNCITEINTYPVKVTRETLGPEMGTPLYRDPKFRDINPTSSCYTEEDAPPFMERLVKKMNPDDFSVNDIKYFLFDENIFIVTDKKPGISERLELLQKYVFGANGEKSIFWYNCKQYGVPLLDYLDWIFSHNPEKETSPVELEDRFDLEFI